VYGAKKFVKRMDVESIIFLNTPTLARHFMVDFCLQLREAAKGS